MIDRRWASFAVNLCVAHGIDHFFLAPGSRCTPLTLAVADHEDAVVTQHIDERGLAFAALGYARATGNPGVFVCTSGTAVANALPAVIEASAECLPMLLFTADRPQELRGTGANQTIDQQRIYGEYARWFFDMPCPAEALGDQFVRAQVERALSESVAGPVHVNWMFREPFGLDPMPKSAFRQVGEPVKPKPPAKVSVPVSGDTLLIAGGCRPKEAVAIKKLATQHGLPLLTDVTSNLCGISPEVATLFDLPEPETIVHFGGRIVSKSWWSYTSALRKTRFVHVTPHDVQINPEHLPLERHVVPIAAVALSASPSSAVPFRKAWEYAESSRREAASSVLRDASGQLTEPALAHQIGHMLTEAHGLFIGNSSPIRDFDRYGYSAAGKDFVLAANRGASGIDGLLATSVGFANGLEKPTTVVLGDLSALHDLNSLALVSQSKQPLVVVVVNNQGGGIFDMLPVATRTEHFEQYFATPHAFGFQDAAAMFGIPHFCAETTSEFQDYYERALRSGKSTIVEAKTDRVRNQAIRQRIQEAIRS